MSVTINWGDNSSVTIDNTSGDRPIRKHYVFHDGRHHTATVNGIHTYNTGGLVRNFAVFTTFSIDGTVIGTVASSAQVALPTVGSLTFDTADTSTQIYENCARRLPPGYLHLHGRRRADRGNRELDGRP